MAEHTVKFTVPERELGNADIEFSVKRDGKQFGRLKVSKGAVEWVPANKSYGTKRNWTELAAFFDGD